MATKKEMEYCLLMIKSFCRVCENIKEGNESFKAGVKNTAEIITEKLENLENGKYKFVNRKL